MGDKRNKSDVNKFWEGFKVGIQKKLSKEKIGDSIERAAVTLPFRLLEMFVIYKIVTTVTGTALLPKEYDKQLIDSVKLLTPCIEGRGAYIDQLLIKIGVTKTISEEDLKILGKFDPESAAVLKKKFAKKYVDISKSKK